MARPKSKPVARPITDVIRAALDASGLTDGQVEKLSGVPKESIRRFRIHERDLMLASLDKLARPLGLRLVVAPKGKARRPQGGD